MRGFLFFLQFIPLTFSTRAESAWNNGLLGHGETLFLVDVGLDTSSCQFQDPDTQEAIVYSRASGTTPALQAAEQTASGLKLLSSTRVSSTTHRKVVSYIADYVGSSDAVTPQNALDAYSLGGTAVATAAVGLPQGALSSLPCLDVPTSTASREACLEGGVTASTIAAAVAPHVGPAPSVADFIGVAPAGRIAVFDIGRWSGTTSAAVEQVLPPGDPAGVGLSAAVELGARTIVYTAPGQNVSATYPIPAPSLDVFLYSNTDFTIVAASGDRTTAGTPGTIWAPAASKNVLSVGVASRLAGGAIDAAPLNGVGAKIGGRQRFKPEVLAVPPAFRRSSLLPTAPTRLPTPNSLGLCSGTIGAAESSSRLAAGRVGGVAMLVRQYLRAGLWRGGGGNTQLAPSTAVRAVIIAGARPLYRRPVPNIDGDLTATEVTEKPNAVSGYGVVDDVARMLPVYDFTGPTSQHSVFVDAARTITSSVGPREFCFGVDTATHTVRPSDGRLRVVVVWMDVSSTGEALGNDLDLEVTTSDGSFYYGNLGTTYDRVNTVELVDIPSPPAGEVRVRISVAASATASIPYSLVINGHLVNGTLPTPTGTHPVFTTCEESQFSCPDKCGSAQMHPATSTALGSAQSYCEAGSGGTARCKCRFSAPNLDIRTCDSRAVVRANELNCVMGVTVGGVSCVCFRDRHLGYWGGDRCDRCEGGVGVYWGPEPTSDFINIANSPDMVKSKFCKTDIKLCAARGGVYDQAAATPCTCGAPIDPAAGWRPNELNNNSYPGAFTSDCSACRADSNVVDGSVTWGPPGVCRCRASSCSGHGECLPRLGQESLFGPACQCTRTSEHGFWGGAADVEPTFDPSYRKPLTVSCQDCAEGYAGPTCRCKVVNGLVCGGGGNCTSGGCVCDSTDVAAVYVDKFRLNGVALPPKFNTDARLRLGHYSGTNCEVCTAGYTRVQYSNGTKGPCACTLDGALECSGHGACGASGCVCQDRFASTTGSADCGKCAAGWTPYPICGCTVTGVGANQTKCGGHGECVNGKCVCHASAEKGFWGGDACDRCADGYEGVHCTCRTAACTATGHQCGDTSCVCKRGWAHGRDEAECTTCAAGFTNSSVDNPCSCAANCGGHGRCNATAGCTCHSDSVNGYWAPSYDPTRTEGSDCSVCQEGAGPPGLCRCSGRMFRAGNCSTAAVAVGATVSFTGGSVTPTSAVAGASLVAERSEEPPTVGVREGEEPLANLFLHVVTQGAVGSTRADVSAGAVLLSNRGRARAAEATAVAACGADSVAIAAMRVSLTVVAPEGIADGALTRLKLALGLQNAVDLDDTCADDPSAPKQKTTESATAGTFLVEGSLCCLPKAASLTRYTAQILALAPRVSGSAWERNRAWLIPVIIIAVLVLLLLIVLVVVALRRYAKEHRLKEKKRLIVKWLTNANDSKRSSMHSLRKRLNLRQGEAFTIQHAQKRFNRQLMRTHAVLARLSKGTQLGPIEPTKWHFLAHELTVVRAVGRLLTLFEAPDQFVANGWLVSPPGQAYSAKLIAHLEGDLQKAREAAQAALKSS